MTVVQCYELLPMNETINLDKYCAQLDILKAAIEKKRPVLANRHGVLYLDNARPHFSINTLPIMKDFGWDILNHPLYFP